MSLISGRKANIFARRRRKEKRNTAEASKVYKMGSVKRGFKNFS